MNVSIAEIIVMGAVVAGLFVLVRLACRGTPRRRVPASDAPAAEDRGDAPGRPYP
jgi:hypothetical protein